MTIKASGSLSIEEIVTEFGGIDPDSLDEYYRGAGLVTENNSGVPASGEMSLNVFYSTVSEVTKLITSNVNNLVLSTLFSETDWVNTKPKIVHIQAGVTVGSTSSGTVACRSGTTVNGQPMGGTLLLMNDGYIYGAGGVGSSGNGGNGGNSFQAEIPMSIDNINGRIYAGGGGGGGGGDGAQVNFYPNGTAYSYNTSITSTLYYWWEDPSLSFYSLYFLNASVYQSSAAPINPQLTGSFFYERGPLQLVTAGSSFYSIRRRYPTASIGQGGNGGAGIGSNQAKGLGLSGTIFTYGRLGGNGGNGGGWGESGISGNSGQGGTTNYEVLVAAQSGFNPGTPGNYIIGNGNVTWIANGSRLGGVS